MRFFKEHKVYSVIILILSFYLYFNFTKIVEPNKLIDKNNIQYVNDIYMSDGRIYNNYLNSKEKKMYLYMLNAAKNIKRNLSFPLSTFDCRSYEECFGIILNAGDAILIDHPELMTYSNFSYSYDGSYIDINMIYAVNFSFINRIAQIRIKVIIDNIREKTKNMSDIEKIKYVYDWIGDNNTYDMMFTRLSKNQSIYNVFLKKNAVCAGFAKASQVIFQNIGINSTTVVGENHMWNIVEVDGKYYYYDSTVAACREKGTSGYYDGLRQSYMIGRSTYRDWYPEITNEEIFLT